ncbi:hypothetical protein [Staphylococcus saprophyticus]|uniref:hypothetical protein n=1 Tax=Staphylococcus saprophyticus TaxID=29385 RepID=UPI000852F260|nr:hypothetical protein [Staphylococcus saprophyticus]MDW4192817.1 hypothetical protein [Staphylococcus saprophyticus]MDW4263747.1 hypothetical protein [Staphylococcus saprophyticus]MDW4308736.1 hypothetical protein [Staphylococcus saprophyticus]MDW4378046.1 hypothetical protein [Staphylococcus saprophyticus]MDW4396925.1 hypothetical protein [Staphylococcus saprophyticus]
MRRKVNNSETHETKRYYEVPSEKVQEWSDTIENLTKQRDQYKVERDTLNSKLNQSYEDNYKLEGQLHDMTQQRDTLIDDLAVLKANISRLERELKKKNMDADRLGYRWRNSHDEAETYKSLLSEFSQHIGNKPSSSTYKYFREKLDGIGIKEGE